MFCACRTESEKYRLETFDEAALQDLQISEGSTAVGKKSFGFAKSYPAPRMCTGLKSCFDPLSRLVDEQTVAHNKSKEDKA
jgi:hypothetical protein